jgi:DNA repair exonuclease SbcCD ATPase subunit
MKIQKRTIFYFLLMGLLAAGCFLISSGAPAADTPSGSSQEVNQLLSQIKTEAKALEDDADVLALWTRARQGGWQSHSMKLSEIREHVNQAGQLLAKLNEAREGASPWQQQAIDRIYPLLKELADNTETTINHLRDNQSRIHFPPYTDYAKAGYDLAKELASLISDYVDYGDHEAEFHRLQEKLLSTAS